MSIFTVFRYNFVSRMQMYHFLYSKWFDIDDGGIITVQCVLSDGTWLSKSLSVFLHKVIQQFPLDWYLFGRRLFYFFFSASNQSDIHFLQSALDFFAHQTWVNGFVLSIVNLNILFFKCWVHIICLRMKRMCFIEASSLRND